MRLSADSAVLNNVITAFQPTTMTMFHVWFYLESDGRRCSDGEHRCSKPQSLSFAMHMGVRLRSRNGSVVRA